MLVAWQRRRAAFNHDWLKNRYIPALGKWLNVLDGQVTDDAFAVTFAQHKFLEWRRESWALKSLLDDFTTEMSPARLLEDAAGNPWCAEWLRSFVRGYWLCVSDVERRLSDVRACADAVERAFWAVHGIIDDWGVQRILAEPGKARPVVAELHEACIALAEAVSALPSAQRPI
jgi:hypothetical protein